MIELFFSAMALGFLFNATPGAIFTESLRRGLQGGFSSALYVQFGSLVGDLTWALLGLGGVAALFEIAAIKMPMALFGGQKGSQIIQTNVNNSKTTSSKNVTSNSTSNHSG